MTAQCSIMGLLNVPAVRVTNAGRWAGSHEITEGVAVMRMGIALVLCLMSGLALSANQPVAGQIKVSGDWVLAWSPGMEQWVPLEAFWWQFVEANERGKHWGEGMKYPSFEDVKERDTFLEITEQGSCLMYFYHGRWRRAQDVWRWDTRQNEVLGCPHVFD